MSEEKAELQLAESGAAILSAPDDTVYAVVDVPEWGCKVRLRSLTSEEWSLYQASFQVLGKDGRVTRNLEAVRVGRGKLVALCAVSSKGQRLFSDEQAAALGKKHMGVMERLCDKVLEISGVTAQGAEDARGN